MRSDDGRLLHRYRDGDASIPAFLDDYAFMTAASLELYDTTFDLSYLERALELQQHTDALFWDEHSGGFFFTAEDSEDLLVRQKEVYDGAIPSGNSMAAENLVRLARLTGTTEFLQRADQLFAAFSEQANQIPSAHSQLLSALKRRVGPSLEVVIAGKPDADDTKTLIETVRGVYRPHAAVILVPPGEQGDAIRRMAPFTESYERVEGHAAAYVCRDFTCQLPTTDPVKLRELLEEAISQPGSTR
jgi:hypothetical protein